MLLFWTSLCAASHLSWPCSAIWAGAVWTILHRPGSPATHHPGPLGQLWLQQTHYPCPDFRATFLYLLTFWLLLHQFVKEKLLKKAKAVIALMEVTVADTVRADSDAALEPGGAGYGCPHQVLHLHECRHVGGGPLRWQPHCLQDCLHVPLPGLPHPLSGVLQPVVEVVQGVLVAGGGLHHVGAHCHLHLPVPALFHVVAQPDTLR